jgi:hypothetical protein
MVITDELKELFEDVRSYLGAPIRSVPLTDDDMCRLLKIAVGDYTEVTQNFIIQNNWLNMLGQDKTKFVNSIEDLTYALTTRAMDWTLSYAQWCSKEVGLQGRGTNPKYELKKDFIQIEAGKQVYVIPAGREVNRVMWITPSTTKAAMFMQNGGLGYGFNGGLGFGGAQIGGAVGFNGFYGCFGSAYDTALIASDLKYKNKFFMNDLAYKITLGPDGTHLLHLLSVPGPRNPNTFGNISIDDKSWGRFKDCYVWYDYYDTDGSQEQIDECRLEHRDTVILSPSDVPLEAMKFELMNYQAQQTVRQLLTAHAMIKLSYIFGRYSGAIKIPQSEATINFGLYHDDGQKERDRVLGELKERYTNMLPWTMAENQQKLVQANLEIQKTKPFVNIYIR